MEQTCRHLFTKPRIGHAQAGYTLAEVVVSVLLISIIVTSVFSVSLTSKMSDGKNDRRLAAGQAARQVSSRLKNFVTGCDCNVTTGACNAASCSIQGPTPRAGVLSWSFNNPPDIIDCWPATPPYGACGNGSDVYALTLGAHDIRGLLPADFAASPFNARVIYTVTTAGTLEGRPIPRVSIDVQWTEP